MELREKIIAALECVPVKVGQTYAEAIADTVLAIPEIRDALRERHEQLGVATKLGRI